MWCFGLELLKFDKDAGFDDEHKHDDDGDDDDNCNGDDDDDNDDASTIDARILFAWISMEGPEAARPVIFFRAVFVMLLILVLSFFTRTLVGNGNGSSNKL